MCGENAVDLHASEEPKRSRLLCAGLQMGFVIAQRTLMDDRSPQVTRIKYKKGHKWSKWRLICKVMSPVNAFRMVAKAEAMEGNAGV